MMTPIRTYVAGHNGMVGSALCRVFTAEKQVDVIQRTHSELDLTDQKAVFDFFQQEKIDEVYLAAAKVGGIQANMTYPADFIQNNLVVQSNVIGAAHAANVKKLLFLGSSCIYPRHAQQPMTEEQLLTGELEPTNEPYAIAKIAGIKLCEAFHRQYGSDFRSVMPTNLYGPGDNFHPENSHVVPALIRRFHEAVEKDSPTIDIWGSGNSKREFMHVDDMAAACVHVMSLPRGVYDSVTTKICSHINVGTGEDCTIRELAETLATITGFKGRLVFDNTRPDGTPRKLLDVSRMHSLGWRHTLSLREGLENACRWYSDNRGSLRSV